MTSLTLETFLGAQHDFERSQYLVLDALQSVRADFQHNRIYPGLANLIEIYGTLQHVTQSGGEIRSLIPRRIRSIDLENQRIEYEPLELENARIEAITDLIDWSMPHIRTAIEEGRTIYHFVDENIEVEQIGLLPNYVEEGYLFLPESPRRLLHVLRYEVSIFTSSDERYRNLKTSSVRTIPMSSIDLSLPSIKMELMNEHRDLPNPATYHFRTALEFPFQETILPVAKRKLLQVIYS